MHHNTASLPVVLGSSSIWRRRVLRDADVDFTAMSADIDEKAIRHPDPVAMTLRIALAKAAALLPRIEHPSLLVTSDQVVAFGDEVREKPKDREEALRWLVGYGGSELRTVTAVVVTETATRRTRHASHVCTVAMGPVPVSDARMAIARGNALSSCGAFVLDNPAMAPHVLWTRGEGGDTEVRTSIDGLPLDLTLGLLRSFGWEPVGA